MVVLIIIGKCLGFIMMGIFLALGFHSGRKLAEWLDKKFEVMFEWMREQVAVIRTRMQPVYRLAGNED